jgi:hypothetical protein
MAQITFEKFTKGQKHPLECLQDNKNSTYDGLKRVVISGNHDWNYYIVSILRKRRHEDLFSM